MNQEQDKKKYVTLSRDFKKIREELDIEIVLKHYGYTLSTSTGNNQLYRIYKPSLPGSSQRIVVMNKADQLFKGFVDLSDTAQKGDSIQFIHTREQGDWKRTFYVIDSLLGHAQYAQWKSQLPELVPTTATQYLDDEKVIQTELIKSYQIKVVTNASQCEYLVKKRRLAPTILLSDQFLGRILQVSSPKGKEQCSYSNIAFPLMSRKGNMVSLDIRGEGYKAFPEGSKGEGLWLSNPLIELKQDTLVMTKDGVESLLSSRKKMYFSKIGIRIDNDLYRMIAPHFQYVVPSEILLTESPIDAISFHQLYPPSADDYRLYVSPCGNPSREQLKHMAHILEENVNSAIILAYDADVAGIRYAINSIGIDSISSLTMRMHYVNEVGDKAFHNRLVISTSESTKDVLTTIKLLLVARKEIVLIKDDVLELTYSIENDLNLLHWLLQQLVDCVNRELGRERFVNYLPISDEKDYNAILKKMVQNKNKGQE